MNEIVLAILNRLNEAAGVPMLTDGALLCAQGTVLALIILRELFGRKGRNFFGVLIATAMLGLVQTQAAWVFITYANISGEVAHLNQVFSMDAARVANAYCFIATGLMAWGLLRRKLPVPLSRGGAPRWFHRDSALGVELLLWMWVTLAAALLIYLLNGITNLSYHPDLVVHGQASLLLALSVGKMPLLVRTIRRERPRVSEIAMALFCGGMILLNSRFMAAFILMQFIAARHYLHREITWKMAAVFFGTMILIFFVYGLYREFASVSGEGVSVRGWSQFLLDFDLRSLCDWFYGFNVEGFVGFAGILTVDMSSTPIVHDFGLSSMGAIMQFIPGKIRMDESLVFFQATEWFRSFIPYNGSVVPAGFEQAYGHFGVLGVFGLGWLIGRLGWKCDAWMRDPQANRLLVVLMSVHVLLLIRGSFAHAIYFGAGDLVVYLFYRLLETAVTATRSRLRTA